ncbi:hypothetical protein Tco_0200682 [Tanacetum coccineum]
MNCIKKIANDAKVIEIDNQMLVLIKRQVETNLMLEEKFRDPYEEVSNFVKEIKDVVKEVERLSCKDVAKETVCLLRRGQKRELYMMTRLQMMVDESHLSVREKHTFSIGLGEREDNSFLVINISGKLIKYSIISKTISHIFDIGSNQMDDEYEFFPAYKVDHYTYGFIPSFGNFFESYGCLLLVYKGDIGSTEFTIYEMMKGSFVWPVSICLGEGEEDAFVVINLSGKVVKYNLTSKTNTEIFDIGSNQMDDDDAAADDDDDDVVLFISPFEVDPNLYEFIPSLASV